MAAARQRNRPKAVETRRQSDVAATERKSVESDFSRKFPDAEKPSLANFKASRTLLRTATLRALGVALFIGLLTAAWWVGMLMRCAMVCRFQVSGTSSQLNIHWQELC